MIGRHEQLMLDRLRAAARVPGRNISADDAEPGFPLLAPDGRLVELRNGAWLRGVARAVGAMEDSGALSLWRAEMGKHLASMAEAGHHEMVEEAERLMDLRRDEFAALADVPA